MVWKIFVSNEGGDHAPVSEVTDDESTSGDFKVRQDSQKNN